VGPRINLAGEQDTNQFFLPSRLASNLVSTLTELSVLSVPIAQFLHTAVPMYVGPIARVTR